MRGTCDLLDDLADVEMAFEAGLTGRVFLRQNVRLFGSYEAIFLSGLALAPDQMRGITTTVSIYRPDIPSQLPQMLPYLLTIIVLTGAVGRATPPAADGQPYEKQ